MNERKVLLFKKTCYDVGTRFSFIVNGKIVEMVISDVMIDYHKNINYEKHSVRYRYYYHIHLVMNILDKGFCSRATIHEVFRSLLFRFLLP